MFNKQISSTQHLFLLFTYYSLINMVSEVLNSLQESFNWLRLQTVPLTVVKSHRNLSKTIHASSRSPSKARFLRQKVRFYVFWNSSKAVETRRKLSIAVKTVPARRRQKAVETHRKPSAMVNAKKQFRSLFAVHQKPGFHVKSLVFTSKTSKLVESFKLQVSWSVE